MNEQDDTICGNCGKHSCECTSPNTLSTDLVAPNYSKYNDVIIALDHVQSFTSLPMETQQDRLKAYNYKNTFASGIQKMKIGGGIMVQHIMITHVEYINAEGEEVKGPQMTLIEPNGTAYRIGAKYLIKQILEFMRDVSAPPYTDPVKMQCTDAVLDNGNRIYQLKLGD